ncbi:MAG: glycosyltransferase [Bdellovibrionales bacterium]|nr:glycosyltransferase [Bdellovibrionales bacterium]
MKISICIPTFNGGKYIQQALDSVMIQIEHVLEVIVLDDLSDDATVSIVESYQKRESKIRLERSNKRLGMVQNWNRCAKVARGELFSILHQDDRYLEDYVVSMKKCFNDPVIDFAYCDVRTINNSDEIIKDEKFSIKQAVGNQRLSSCSEPYVWDASTFAKNLLNGCFVNCPTVVFKKKSFSAVGGFDARFEMVQDWEFWFRASSNGYKFAHLPKPLYDYRVHQENATSRYKKSFKKYEEREALLSEMFAVAKSNQWVESKDWNKVRKTLFNVLLWDALEDLVVGRRRGFLEKLDYGDSCLDGFSSYPPRRIFPFIRILGPKMSSILMTLARRFSKSILKFA